MPAGVRPAGATAERAGAWASLEARPAGYLWEHGTGKLLLEAPGLCLDCPGTPDGILDPARAQLPSVLERGEVGSALRSCGIACRESDLRLLGERAGALLARGQRARRVRQRLPSAPELLDEPLVASRHAAKVGDGRDGILDRACSEQDLERVGFVRLVESLQPRGPIDLGSGQRLTGGLRLSPHLGSLFPDDGEASRDDIHPVL